MNVEHFDAHCEANQVVRNVADKLRVLADSLSYVGQDKNANLLFRCVEELIQAAEQDSLAVRAMIHDSVVLPQKVLHESVFGLVKEVIRSRK